MTIYAGLREYVANAGLVNVCLLINGPWRTTNLKITRILISVLLGYNALNILSFFVILSFTQAQILSKVRCWGRLYYSANFIFILAITDRVSQVLSQELRFVSQVHLDEQITIVLVMRRYGFYDLKLWAAAGSNHVTNYIDQYR